MWTNKNVGIDVTAKRVPSKASGKLRRAGFSEVADVPATGASIVYLALRAAIIDQALMPGQKLPEDAIGRQFSVSRTLVREAINRLALEGLVDVRRNSGASIANPSLHEARNVFDVRRNLERMVVASLAGRLTREQVRALDAHVALEIAASRKDGPESIRLAGEFHIKLAALTNNDLLLRYVREVTSQCSLILALYDRPHSSECAVTEHKQLIRALRMGDAKAALKLSDEHLGAVVARARLARPTIVTLDAALAPYARNRRQDTT
jgi:DNA-binding GntR family transcriptional regulator